MGSDSMPALDAELRQAALAEPASRRRRPGPKQEEHMRAELDGTLEPFRPGFDADGFAVSVEDVIDGVVVLQIVHKPNACEECLIPDDMMGPMLTTAFRNVAPDVTG